MVDVRGAYGEELVGYRSFCCQRPFHFKHGGVIPDLELAYETWGELNQDHSNAILLHTGLSASSHACSHPVRLWVGLVVETMSSDTRMVMVRPLTQFNFGSLATAHA